jgi:predicted Holliday junction resolvase-like endonuclease
MDTTNLILILVITLLALNLVLVGVYIALILKEVRETVRKVNALLDTTNNVADAVSEPVIGASHALGAITTGKAAYNLVKEIKRRRAPRVSSIMEE